jgi:hypothetical protein
MIAGLRLTLEGKPECMCQRGTADLSHLHKSASRAGHQEEFHFKISAGGHLAEETAGPLSNH